MKQFTSCFIGVPLQKKYQKQFEILLADIGKLYPDWQMVYPKTPHITIYYLDKQSQYIFPEITEIIQKQISALKDTILTVGSFDNFTKQETREVILFLNIFYPLTLADFNKTLADTLSRYYSANNNLPFHPHMTVARIFGLKSELNFKENILQLKQKIGKVGWKFPLTEIVIYGVDSTKHPQHQEKLIHIPI